MSPKELLYIEDALGHEQFFMAQCQEAVEKLQDQELQQTVRKLYDKHQKIFGTFYSLV